MNSRNLVPTSYSPSNFKTAPPQNKHTHIIFLFGNLIVNNTKKTNLCISKQ